MQGDVSKGTVSDVAINIAIDVGAIVGAVLLWDRDAAAEKKAIERFTTKEKQVSAQLSSTEINEREALLSKLPMEIIFSESNENVTRIVSVGDLQIQGKQNLIIVAGSQAFVKDALISARIEGSNLFTTKETYVVPVVYEDEQLLSPEDNKGFGNAAKDSLMSAPYIGRPTQVSVWLSYLKQEVDLADKQGTKDVVKQGLVLAVNQKGQVIRRGLGLPPWKDLCEELTKKKK
jgi:hypothetical protein